MSEKEQGPQHHMPYKEIVEYMLKKHDIHEGIWGVYARFSFGAVNTRDSAGEILPASVTGIKEIGISPFPEESTIAFDAAKLNPLKQLTKRTKKK